MAARQGQQGAKNDDGATGSKNTSPTTPTPTKTTTELTPEQQAALDETEKARLEAEAQAEADAEAQRLADEQVAAEQAALDEKNRLKAEKQAAKEAAAKAEAARKQLEADRVTQTREALADATHGPSDGYDHEQHERIIELQAGPSPVTVMDLEDQGALGITSVTMGVRSLHIVGDETSLRTISQSIDASDHGLRIVTPLTSGELAVLRGPIMSRAVGESLDGSAAVLNITSSHPVTLED